jgi:hypothetical protein
MSGILGRINDIAISEGITITALEKKIGASKGVLSRALNNESDIQSKWVQAIVENYPQYNAEWLLTGRGPMLKPEGSYNNVEPAPARPKSKANPEAEDTTFYSMMLDHIGRLEREGGRRQAEYERLEAENVLLRREIDELKDCDGPVIGGPGLLGRSPSRMVAEPPVEEYKRS